ncbi:hypothetical protein GCM10023317_32190 [Actinopolymorpha pittospori]
MAGSDPTNDDVRGQSWQAGAALDRRETAGLSTTQLAAAIGRTTYTVASHERGRRQPPTDVAAHMAELLAVSVDDQLA